MQPITQDELGEWLAFAKTVAREAGAEIQQVRERDEVVVHRKRFDELVTSADLASDHLIRERILAKYPNHCILSEEQLPGGGFSFEGPLWVVDPLDGTVNFAYGMPFYCVSIAFAWDGLVQVGAVFAPDLDLMYSAARGLGAHRGGEPIRTGAPGSLLEALVGTGFPYDRDEIPAAIARSNALSRSCRDIRRIGSAALDICFVADGRLDAHSETLSPWDFAAAGLIAREAGAEMAHVEGVPDGMPPEVYGHEVMFSAPTIAGELLSLLRGALG